MHLLEAVKLFITKHKAKANETVGVLNYYYYYYKKRERIKRKKVNTQAGEEWTGWLHLLLWPSCPSFSYEIPHMYPISLKISQVFLLLLFCLDLH